MPIGCSVRVGEYQDSIALMQTAQQLTRLPGVVDAALVMATQANKALLQAAGLWTSEVQGAHSNDLIVIVKAETREQLQSALRMAQTYLAVKAATPSAGATMQPRSVRTAVGRQPQSNVAVISVAGHYAAGEAWEALKCGLNVLLFSDNVALEEEIALKRYAVERGLLLMGPGCGTAILNGVALGFANVVPRGPVGIVAAAGTGLQEVSSLLARLGVGISQGIGTGGRDVREEVGGLTMLQGLRALQDDPQTQVIVLVSKPPSSAVVERVLGQVQSTRSAKSTVICFLGSDFPEVSLSEPTAQLSRTLQEAAYRAAAQTAGYAGDLVEEVLARELGELRSEAVQVRKRLRPRQKYLRGLFSGGTLQAEALLVFRDLVGDVWSNAPLESRLTLHDVAHSVAHCALDLGEEEFTVGRPHPMIDNDLRIRRLLQEGADPEVAVIMLDVVLGYGAHPDPASELGPAIRHALELALAEDRDLLVVASVTGTSGDPQDLNKQVQALEAAGAIVCSCNAAAARLAGLIVEGRVD